MPKQSSNFKIGIFVILGLLIGLGSLIYLSVHQYLKGTNTYVTFFEESVQGLQVDSTVKYRGVEVGRVRAIQVAPDNNLIEVVMDILLQGSLSNEVVAQLKTVGITGIAYIELDRKISNEENQSPYIKFISEYPIIPSRPSEITQLFSLVEDLTRQFRRIDFKIILDETQRILSTTRELLKNKQIKKIINNLESTTTTIDTLINYTNYFIRKGDFKILVEQLLTNSYEFKSLIKMLQIQITGLRLNEITQQTNEFITELRNDINGLSNTINFTFQNLRQTSESLRRLFTHLENTPSDIFFSSPPPYYPSKSTKIGANQ